MNAIKVLGLTVISGCFLSAHTQAIAAPSDDFGTEISLSTDNQSKSDIEGQNNTFSMRSSTFSLNHSMPIHNQDVLYMGFEAQQFDIKTQALIPGTQARVPDKISGASINLGWMHAMDNDMSLTVEGNVGSLSDKPFSGSNSLSYSLTGMLEIPSGERNAWELGLGHANEYGSSEVVPILAYQWNPSDTFQARIGLPFIEATWQPHERVELFAAGGEGQIELSSTFYISENTALFAGYKERSWSARRAARTNDEALLNFEQKETSIGISQNFDPFTVSLMAGRTSGTKFSESKDDDKGSSNRLDIDGSNFIRLSISTDF
ncbi:MAG: DUF6268 family outer membrane beta-barrel protein [Amphritea sp.]|nr:DUF6268 family outer membrane beta-barrel protein [Amphritea sp.]